MGRRERYLDDLTDQEWRCRGLKSNSRKRTLRTFECYLKFGLIHLMFSRILFRDYFFTVGLRPKTAFLFLEGGGESGKEEEAERAGGILQLPSLQQKGPSGVSCPEVPAGQQ